MDTTIVKTLQNAAGDEHVFLNEPMKSHTTFRIGGPADIFVTPASEGALRRTIAACIELQVPWYLIGNGSNLLVGDQGVRGVVIQCDRSFNAVTVDGNYVFAQAGAMLSQIARMAMNYGLTGLEFASGIPGTLGGAMTMNAGAYGGEIKDVTDSVSVLDPASGCVHVLSREEMDFGYRHSVITEKKLIVLNARLRLDRGEVQEILARMEELKGKRVSKQPLDKPSAGSTFKRPEGHFAGKLIMDSGLAGKRIGGAVVSAKHCGFIVNEGDATAKDVRELIRLVQNEVNLRYGVMLEPEVRMLGEF